MRAQFATIVCPKFAQRCLQHVGTRRKLEIFPTVAVRSNVQCTALVNRLMHTSSSSSYERISQTICDMKASPVVLCIRENDSQVAYSAACAAIRGGVKCLEMTLTTPGATSMIGRLREGHPEALIGAGTVLTHEDVKAAADAGAAFAMSPVTDAAIIRTIHEHGLLAIPGAATPTEIWRAFHHAGARMVKIFPVAQCGGIDFVRALQGPLPQVPLLPTNGMPSESAADFLRERNVIAVGACRQIIPRELLRVGDWDAVTRLAHVWAEIAARSRSTTNISPE